MSPTGTKGLIDIEKRTLDRLFEDLCLAENRTHESVERFVGVADSLIRLLRMAKEEVRKAELVVH